MWDVELVAHVLSQSEKCDDDHNVRVRLRMRERRGVLTQACGAVDLGTLRGKMEKLDPGRATGTSSDRTDANGERPPQKCTIGGEADDGPREVVHLKALHAKIR